MGLDDTRLEEKKERRGEKRRASRGTGIQAEDVTVFINQMRRTRVSACGTREMLHNYNFCCAETGGIQRGVLRKKSEVLRREILGVQPTHMARYLN